MKNISKQEGEEVTVDSEKVIRPFETSTTINPAPWWYQGNEVKCPVIVQKVPDYEDYYVGYWPLCNRPTAYLVQGTMLCEAHARYALHGRDYAGKPVAIQPTDFETCTDENHCWLPGEIRCLCIKGYDGNDIPLCTPPLKTTRE